MNGHQRISCALRGERPDRVPVMLHHFMFAAREAGVSMGEFRRNPEALAGALAVPCELPEDEPAVCRGSLLRSLDEVETLAPPEVGRSEWIQA
jgi:hypothetical protein